MEKSMTDIKTERDDIERGVGPIQAPNVSVKTGLSRKLLLWIAVNVVATVTIVYINKSIFSDPALQNCQSSFVAFHFTVTWVTLYIASHNAIGMFAPARARILSILPLTIAMSGNVLLMNLSLAYSSIILYQIVRILLTPLTAGLNFFLYGARIPFSAGLALLPACAGVGIISYVESLPQAKTSTQTTSKLGVVFAFSGVAMSSLYTVLVAASQRRSNMSSAQLLFNQMPLGVLVLGSASFFTDSLPVWSEVATWQWSRLCMSGLCASMINLSQFNIIIDAGPVTSTVVGHLKTILIIGLGWVLQGKNVGNESLVGVMLAVFGITSYAYISLR